MMANKILLFIIFVLLIKAANADGWHLSDQQVHLLEPNQKAVISWDGKNETMILATALKSYEIANFAWIIPIQSSTKPEVTAGNISIFEDLVEFFKKEGPKSAGVIAEIMPGVEVVESKEVDIYDITILRATISDDLISWLNNNENSGFLGFGKKKELVDVYIEKEVENQVEVRENSFGMTFVLIPAGEFMMGFEEFYWAKPVHKVRISKPFYLGTYPVTQQEWKEVMGNNPSYFKGDNLPVEMVSLNDAQEFIKKLNEKEGMNKYRLPSEAEWEYAARAGTTTRFSFGDDESKLGDYAWHFANSRDKTHEVGTKKPNPWGLYDMHGNVWEWVLDKWHDNYNGAPTDESSWESGDSSHRVDRGGGWDRVARLCCSAVRGFAVPGNRASYFGFRLLRIS